MLAAGSRNDKRNESATPNLKWIDGLRRCRLHVRLANEEDVAVDFAAQHHQGANRSLEVIVTGSHSNFVEHRLDFCLST